MAVTPSGAAASTRSWPIPRQPAAASSTSLLRAGPQPPRQRSSASRPQYTHEHGGVLLLRGLGRASADLRCRRRLLTARGESPPDPHHDGDEGIDAAAGFDAAVALFNGGDYHACHDVVEELWYAAEDPARTLLHAILQCAVGFHHLFNQNHRGAMMELGEGLCKLRKLHLLDDQDNNSGPFTLFRDEVAAVLQFLYRTQKELAACTDDLCLTMDGSPSSYQLLGNFAAGQQLYRLGADADGASTIIFSAPTNGAASQAVPSRVKLPTLHATEQHLKALQYTYRYM